MQYQDLGPDYYERQHNVRRQIAHQAGKFGALGFEVTLCRIPEPEPDGIGQTTTAQPKPSRTPSPAPTARVRYRAPS